MTPRWRTGAEGVFANGVEMFEEEVEMPRKVGARFTCESCGAVLVYEKACPCPEGMPHSEICCGKQMKQVEDPPTPDR